jgi:hypothetical protein
MAEIMPETFWWKYIKNNRVHFLVIYIFLYMTNGRKLERTKMSFLGINYIKNRVITSTEISTSETAI